ncbi:hypothetical protein [Micromonospora sp. NPDC049891]|uniref:hypothetical protein n=1 Tax=Micromonospora sp. NPDC049891 TaxID=3155655 RepID=UPI0033E9A15E
MEIGIGFPHAAAYGGSMQPAALLNRVAAVTAPTLAVLPASGAAPRARRIPARAGHGQPRPAGRSPPETVHRHVTAKGEAHSFGPFSFSGKEPT